MGRPDPQKERDWESNSGRDCDWAAGGSGALASVYAMEGDIIFREPIGKMYTGMPKCDMDTGDEETSM